MKTSKNVCLRLLLLSCLLSPNALAQQPAPGPPSQRPASLAQALRAMPPASVGDGAVALTVSPERVLPAPAPPPSDGEAALPNAPIPTPQSLADRYGRLGGWFGHVYALAPPTMTVLSSNPALADLPLSVLASQHPMPFLIGSLSQEQLRQMGTAGLAFGDLTPDQQGLLQAMLPHPFQTVPRTAKEPTLDSRDLQKPGADVSALFKANAEATKAYNAQGRTVPEETLYASLRLHGFLADGFAFDSPAGSGIGLNASQTGFETTGAFKAARGGRMDMAEPGKNPVTAYLRAEAPNAPKDGDLDWRRRDLERPVSLLGLKTVDDLAARLARATGLELYADPHYGPQPLLVVGDLKKPQPAGNVMQTLALCVCGTWRQLGPAYVLTDDVQGLGARQEFLREMVQTWSNRLTKAGEEVGGRLRDMDWMHALHFAEGDAGALSPAQIDGIYAQHKTNDGSLPWKDLPDSLKTSLHRQLTASDSDDSFAATSRAVAQGLKPDTPVRIDLKLQLAVSLPDTGDMALGEAYRVHTPREPLASGSPPSLGGQANSISVDKPLRGLLCAPKTPDEARAVVARLPRMGLNTLLLDVFTNGRTFFPNTALPPESGKAAGVLQAALDAAKPLHIPVYAVLDTLCWRKDGAAPHPKPWPTGFAEDLTVGGETPDHAVQRELDAHSVRNDSDREYLMVREGNQGWASPLDPHVRALLPALVRSLAATPGLAGLAFQDTAPPGYLSLENDYREQGIALGYTTEARLVYLRRNHVDPVDLPSGYSTLQLFLPSEGFSTDFDISLPNFSTSDVGIPTFDGTGWTKYRGDADQSLLADCYAAARQAVPALPLFMRERRMGVTFDPWTDPNKLNQYPSLATLDYPFHAVTPRSILTVPYGPVERAHPDWFVWGTNYGGPAGDASKRAGGEVFDLVTGYSPDSLADTLDRLGAFLKKPAKP
jgi:hypothetical protein